MENVQLRACPLCGGRPVVLVMQQCLENVVMIQCSSCGVTTGGVMWRSGKGPVIGRRDLLPDLATARRQAAAVWNGHECERDEPIAAERV